MILVQQGRRESHKLPARKEVGKQRSKKSLGQNFLIDRNIAQKIVDALSVSQGETILEIGPGKGSLTHLLAEKTSRVIAVEKDEQLCQSLKQEFASFPYFELINGNFLDYDFNFLNNTVKVIGNIPYNLTSKIISKLVDSRSQISFAVLMVQDEVADRLAAKPGTKAYGAISIRLQLTAEVKKLFSVSSACFRPKPSVNSRVLQIAFKNREPFPKEVEFVVFIKKAFGMRRKMLRHFISYYYGRSAVETLPREFHARRIETFPPEDIYKIFLILDKDA